MTPLFRARDGAVWVGDSTRELPEGAEWDVCCVDPPYGARCHSGHDWSEGIKGHNAISYPSWTPADVRRAVQLWHPRTRGWFLVMSDHGLQRAWEEELRAVGRYVFAPLPLVSPGSRVRLCGDGPSSWTVWLTVARPRGGDDWKKGTKPGYYRYPPEDMPVVGGKPVGLLRAILADYSEPGDIICDPTCGAGSALEAARDLGRRWLGMDIDEGRARMAAGRMGSGFESGPLFEARG